MQVSNPNNKKIYNLSTGKTLPEWLSDRRKRQLQKQDIDIRRRITLLQDFEMPTVSNCVTMSNDGRYIYACGVYKPRIRCYDVTQMCLKFERCVDSEVVKLLILSDDYSKFVVLQNDRYFELHAQFGRYYRSRVPKFGRDMAYHDRSCDLYIVGVSPEIYRINLEQGRFMSPLKTDAKELNCCEFNSEHELFMCGTSEGKVDGWDPRVRNRVGLLDCAQAIAEVDDEIKGVPSVTSLKYRDALTIGVGTSTGHVLLYDIRSSKAVLTKDHMYGLPIKKLAFHNAGGQDLVMSIDSKILKLWYRHSGKAFTSIEPGTTLNDLCLCEDSGIVFMANEAPKLLSYFIPSLGPAPRWCSFLDNLTEELEETDVPTVYDDYKFATRRELDELGLSHLIGSNLLRAYMHGYFMDMRLYHKAKSIVEPFAYEDYRRQKIRQKIDEQRANRVTVKKLPKVNKVLAAKLMDEEESLLSKDSSKKQKRSGAAARTILKDSRFSAMFINPDFEVDTECDEYKLLNPVVTKIDKQKQKKREREILASQFEEVEPDGRGSEEPDGRPSSEESSSDDDQDFKRDVQESHRLLREKERSERLREAQQKKIDGGKNIKFMELKTSADVVSFSKNPVKRKKISNVSLEQRLKTAENERNHDVVKSVAGGHEMTFSWKKRDKDKDKEERDRLHHLERKKLRRSAGELPVKKQPPKFWMGKRVK